MISLRTLPFLASTPEELLAWLQIQSAELAHDYELPKHWSFAAQGPRGCLVLSKAVMPVGEPTLCRLVGAKANPVLFEVEGFLPEGERMLVKGPGSIKLPVPPSLLF